MSSQSMSLPRLMLMGSVLLLSLQLVACSSGGGGSSDTTKAAPDAPSLSLTPTAIKTFRFSWTDVSGETKYRLLEDPDGSSGYTEVASIAADATGHDLEVFLPARINAGYILQACNSAGCSDSAEVFVGGTLSEAVGYVKASNTEAGDWFGYNVALSGDGDTLAVGAYAESSNATGIDGDQGDNAASDSGAVYVYTRNGGTWTQQAYIKAPNTEAGDWFGISVALSTGGNTLAVGAFGEDSSATGLDGDQSDNAASLSGAVYVYTRTGGVWSQQAYVKAANTEADDWFGQNVALSGDGTTLAVGASGEDSSATGIDGDQSDNAASLSGAVYVYTRSGGTWSQQAYVKASGTGGVDYFGSSVKLSSDGDTLAVGALGEDSNATGIDGDQGDNSASGSGAVYVFIRSGATWSQQAYVKASNTESFDRFGYSLGLSDDGNTLAVGAYTEGSSATGIDGDQSDNTATDSGAVYIFTRSGTTWTQQAYIKASNAGAGDKFGISIALSGDGNVLAVGAHYEDSSAIGLNGDQSNNTATESGAAYLFNRSRGTWSQQAYIKASNNTGGSDKLGKSVVLTADGATLAVGARYEDSSATGIDGDQSDNTASASGAVYLY